MSASEKDAIERRDEAIELLEDNEQWVEAYEKNGRDFPIRRWLTGTKPSE